MMVMRLQRRPLIVSADIASDKLIEVVAAVMILEADDIVLAKIGT